MTLVVDASVALKWFLPNERDTAAAMAIIAGGEPLIAPELLVAEICQAAWRAARIGLIERDHLQAIADAIPTYFDALIGIVALASRAAAIANQLDHSVYDCLYVAVAEAHGTGFVTADRRLFGKLQDTVWSGRVILLAGYSGAA